MTLIAELKRRNVFKVSAAYLALAWVMVQLTGTAAPAFDMPAWTLKLVMWIAMLGFPFVVMFAWIFELTPEGLKRESEIDRSQSITRLTGRRLDYTIIGLLVAAIAMFALDRFVPSGDAVGAGLARDKAPAAGAETAEASRAQGALPQTQSTPAQATPDDKSIAVLPFVNMSSDKEQEYFSDGIAEELLNLLAKIPELKVIARTSSFAFKGEKTDIADIAKKLNVAHVLEGSVRKSGNKVRITAQLVRASDSVHLWSETYDRSLDDIFAVQDEIAGAVVEQLKVALLGAVPKAKAVNPEAYALMLKAKHFADLITDDGDTTAVGLYEQALALDPDNAQAWDGLARVYLNQGANAELPQAENLVRVRAAIQKALEADPNYALAHARLGSLAQNFDGDLAAAARHFGRALELAPADPSVVSLAASLLLILDRKEQAVAAFKYVTARDPVSAVGHYRLGFGYLYTANWDGAIAAEREALSISPGLTGAPNFLGMALLLKGDAEAALAAFADEQDEEFRVKGAALSFHAMGRTAEFDKAFAELRDRWGAEWPSEIAQVYARTGDADQAFAWLEKAIAKNEQGLTEQFLNPFYTAILGDPRWQTFRERTGTSAAQLAQVPFELKLPNAL